MSAPHHGLTRFDQLMKACLKGEGPARPPLAQTLGRLLPANPVQQQNIGHQGVVDALHALAETMRATENLDGTADAGMTFFGQFVDHDVTLDATSALGTRIDPATILNIRTPGLDLDCVYGSGPEASPHLYGGGAQHHMLVFGRQENPLDLARTCAGTALIGDPRNDENILIAQVQGLFIELHNILMTKAMEGGVEAGDIRACAHDGLPDKVWRDHVPPRLTTFEEVRRFIRLHYQWIVWNELLPAFVDRACLDDAMQRDIFGADAAVMPVEFTGACYRFGHATTQFEYALTEGAQPKGLFEITGFSKRAQAGNIDYGMFFQLAGGPAAQKARPVAPKLGEPLFALPFVTGETRFEDPDGQEITLSEAQSRILALRNMVRDRYTYQLASGQQVAAKVGADEVEVPDALKAVGITKTPLWFYALQEAEPSGRLTGAGGAVVASVFANLLKRDRSTVHHLPHFQPWGQFGGQPSCLAGIIAYAAAHRGQIADPQGLMCG
ncbi:peroxidase family protein [Jannaschia formosa]|uniref:peroxidase family protein n=1 Tax=Jannaschia formosa TaxID=2259592 RepID=UPI000E1B68D9|nr:peroxidase family protein [Jannaschia formosa]TFL19879.1 hypothetical protein DR046_00590 [Jannaschia formosa]